MDKFSPLDLKAYFNAGRSNVPLVAGARPPWQVRVSAVLGCLPSDDQIFWGVPFALGPAQGARCWIMLGDGQDGVDIALPPQTAASYVVFAHFCNSSHGDQLGNPRDSRRSYVTRPGEHLADYSLCYADGSVHRQGIRRRFEISDVTIVWSQPAFAARPHATPYPVDLSGPHGRGEWFANQQGARQDDATPALYWIYALPNPHPERTLKSVRLEATGADTIAVSGITLYHGQEHPLWHRQLETLRVSLPPEQAAPLDQIPVDVDLGIVARKYAPPPFEPKAWLAADQKGCGEEPLPAAPVKDILLDVTASPASTLRVGRHSIDMSDVYSAGAAESGHGARVEILTAQRTWLHATVFDDSTGLPTPCRVHFRAPDGRYFPPYGHRHEVNDNYFEDYGGDLKLGSTQYAYVDGRFQIELPVGPCYVEISKGFEYEPVRAKIEIQPGQRDMSLHLGRRFDFRRQGWVTADTHVHFISPQTAWLEAQAEGLNLLNLLATQLGDLFTNVADITGDASSVSQKDTIVWVGTENRQHLLGHISLLGVRGDPIYPMCADGPLESYLGDPLHMCLAEWADRCREREGVVVIPHFPHPYAEVVADIVLGKVDAVEPRDFFGPTLNTFALGEWYRFLNLGHRVAAVGGTDKMSAGMPVGALRTYAHLGDEEFSFASWARAVRAGRTFTTSGPLIGLEVEGQGLGDSVHLPSGGGTLEAHAWVRSAHLFHVLQVVVNGEVVAEEKAESGTREARLNARLEVSRSSWVAARCLSMNKVWHVSPIHMVAHTSPVYVTVDDQEQFSPSDATYMLTLLDGGLTWLDTLSIPANRQRQAEIRRVFESAGEELRRRMQTHER